jgi:hypothetical protein
MIHSVGFTGTRKGMTDSQEARVEDVLKRLRVTGASRFHHGDCIGADEMACWLARRHGYLIVCHPPWIQTKRADTKWDEIRAAKPYLERNRNIVAACQLLIATPYEAEEQRRGGTWSTVRYARTLGREIELVLP